MSEPGNLALLGLVSPEIAVALAGLLTLAIDLAFLKRSALKVRVGVSILIACAGCTAAIALLALQSVDVRLPNGMLVLNNLTGIIQIALLILTILTLLLAGSIDFTAHVSEYVGLILFATVAMMFLVATQNLLLIFVSLEFLSLSLYLLTGFDKRSRQSAEAALKYFFFGGMSAGFLLFGMSLLYGLSGSLDLAQIGAAVGRMPLDSLALIAIVTVVIGFGFKVAAAPFHLWAPDAYQGAPTPSAGLIASGSKVASFYIFAQFATIGLAGVAGRGFSRTYAPGWIPVLTLVAALSMLVGNLAAIAQTSVRRLLAYSAVGHAGYMLLALIANNRLSMSALLYYVITYALAALGAFGVLGALEKEGVDSLQDLAGLSRRAPGLSFCMLIFLLSLAGIPPLAGFFGKFYLFAAALGSRARFGLLWLVLLAIATSTISLYYYLRVLKQIYVVKAPADQGAIRTGRLAGFALWTIAALVVLLGCEPSLLMGWIFQAMGPVLR